MLSKRVIACLDVRDGKLAKSVKFVDTKDIGDPVQKAREYYEDGLDELVFYDITASSDKRRIMLDVVEAVEVLRGAHRGRLRELAVAFAARGLSVTSGRDLDAAAREAERALDDGSALERFRAMI